MDSNTAFVAWPARAPNQDTLATHVYMCAAVLTYFYDLCMRVPVCNLLHHSGQIDIVLSKPKTFLVEVIKHVLQDGGLALYDGRYVLSNGRDHFEIDTFRVSAAELVV